MMKKKILLLCLLGAPVGLALSTLITIAISFSVGDGVFYPVVPQLAAQCGGELNAVLLQAGCSMLYGAAWAGASVIWTLEGWSLLRQTVTHLLVCSAATFPIAYLMYWIPHNAAGALLYFGIFAGIYLAVWLLQYAATKKKLRQINERLRGDGAQPGQS